jgi:hypothetical protein
MSYLPILSVAGLISGPSFPYHRSFPARRLNIGKEVPFIKPPKTPINSKTLVEVWSSRNYKK